MPRFLGRLGGDVRGRAARVTLGLASSRLDRRLLGARRASGRVAASELLDPRVDQADEVAERRGDERRELRQRRDDRRRRAGS
jgi:hypothetical protein